MGPKFQLFIFILTLFLTNKCDGKAINKKPEEVNDPDPDNVLDISERECDYLLKRLKRDASTNFIEDDDAFIENLIKSTLTKEKQKCIDKYHLLEMPRRVVEHDDVDEAKELRREVSKLKDLVNVIKDQRYILKNLESPTQKHADLEVSHSKTSDDHDLENLRSEMKKLHNILEHSTTELPKPDVTDYVQDKLDKQQLEITNLKHLLQGVLVEMKATKKQGTTPTTEAPKSSKDMVQMMKELSLLEKKLENMQHPAGKSEVVAMRPPSMQNYPLPNQNTSILSESHGQMQGRSASSSERASEDELNALLSLLAPTKSTSSVDSLLKSLDSDSDDELQRRILTLEKQMKRKKKQQFEDKLKSLEKQLSHGSSQSIQSKSDDLDIGDNAQLKRLLVKMIKKKNQHTESKSLDDDEVLDELKALQKSIKSLSSDDDDLFEDLEEKNANLDVTLEKLINAGGSGGGTIHKRRKLSQAQIQALRRRIMAMKQGNLGGGGGGGGYGGSGNDYGEADGDGNAEGSLYGHSQGHGYGHGEDYAPQWQIIPGGPGNNYGAGQPEGNIYGTGGAQHYAHEAFGQYNHGSGVGKGGPSYGPSKFGPNFGNVDQFYGNPGGYSNVPTNQFGTPMYPSFGNYQGGYPVHSGYQDHQGQSKYLNGNSAYSTVGPVYSQAASGAYQGGSVTNYKPFFPSQEAPSSSYNSQHNSGAPGATQSYPNQPSTNTMGPASVTDLKNQIYELQGVINTFNKPEYVQKPEDKAIVYNLNNQINELKGVVNTLQETPYSGQGAAQTQTQGAYQTPHSEAYAGPAPASIQNQQYVPVEQEAPQHPPLVIQPQPQVPVTYSSPAQPQSEVQAHGEYQHPPSARSYQTFRKRRDIDDHRSAFRRNEDFLNTFGTLLGEVFNMYNDETDSNSISSGRQREAIAPQVPHVFDDINAKLADVRKQLDHRVLQQQQRLRRPIALLPQLPSLQHPQLRNNDYNGGYSSYGGYQEDSYGYDKEKDTKLFKFKKDDKKSDVFDKIFDKILDKIIDKLKKAFPKILEVIFGHFDFNDEYYGDSYGYGNNYGAQNYKGGGGGGELAKTFHGMGLFGLLPMIIVKFLSKLHYIVQYLQKYKFFKTFLIPALVLLLAAGGIIFLVWWLQPNEEYKQISYEETYPTYHSNHQPEMPYSRESLPMRSLQPERRQELGRGNSREFQHLNHRDYGTQIKQNVFP